MLLVSLFATSQEIRGYDSMDALDILISHFTGNPHRKKAQQTGPRFPAKDTRSDAERLAKGDQRGSKVARNYEQRLE